MRGNNARRRRLALWVAHGIMPHEPAIRAWLARSTMSKDDADDLVQEAYCRISALDHFEHIENPGAFFFHVVRNLMLNRIKRAKVVRIDMMADLTFLDFDDDGPSPEQVTGDRREWRRVSQLIDILPERCRRILQMRKIEGLPQRKIAEILGITEHVVENESARGLKLILTALRAQGEQIADEYAARRVQRTRRS